ncbi:PaaI family thioesterase [Gilvimarinus sp. F26214L]|uniref:PaaI family thioesterase n=1 Tax=Gilvimarinus sp. DZF01 TaxID=3461371 RepID=UPI0040453DB1
MSGSPDFQEVFRRAREQNQAQLLVDAIPYAGFLGIRALEEDGELIFHLPPRQLNVGNPVLPALHGGAVAGFLEMSAVVCLLMSIDPDKLQGPVRIPKLVDFSVDYVRACRLTDSYAACEVVRQGRKLANVAVRIWQDDRSVTTATARSHYLLV